LHTLVPLQGEEGDEAAPVEEEELDEDEKAAREEAKALEVAFL
jgi:hypothetical protein